MGRFSKFFHKTYTIKWCHHLKLATW